MPPKRKETIRRPSPPPSTQKRRRLENFAASVQQRLNPHLGPVLSDARKQYKKNAHLMEQNTHKGLQKMRREIETETPRTRSVLRDISTPDVLDVFNGNRPRMEKLSLKVMRSIRKQIPATNLEQCDDAGTSAIEGGTIDDTEQDLDLERSRETATSQPLRDSSSFTPDGEERTEEDDAEEQDDVWKEDHGKNDRERQKVGKVSQMSEAEREITRRQWRERKEKSLAGKKAELDSLKEFRDKVQRLALAHQNDDNLAVAGMCFQLTRLIEASQSRRQ